MIYSARLRRTLKFIETEYQRHLLDSDTNKSVIFAKLGVLEYCGWLEEAFDEVARNCVRGKLRTKKSRKTLEDKIKNTHGFQYNSHVQPMLSHALGMYRYQEIERELQKDGSIDRLVSNIGLMLAARREAAHTYTSGRTSQFQAPSVTIKNLNETEPIIIKFWELVRS